MALVVFSSAQQDEITGYRIKKLDPLLVSKGAMRHHVAGRGVSSFQIPQFDEGTTGDYDGSDITFHDQTMSDVTLLLTEKKTSLPQVDIIDNYENQLNIITGMVDRAVVALAQVMDIYTFKTISDTTGIPAMDDYTADKASIIDQILDIGTKMDENNVPAHNRKLYVPPFVSALLTGANITLNTNSANQAVEAGRIGHFAGFSIYMSNNLPDGVATGSKIMLACFAEGGDFAQSLKHSELINREANFKTAYKTLTSYGSIISNPKCYVKCEVKRA